MLRIVTVCIGVSSPHTLILRAKTRLARITMTIYPIRHFLAHAHNGENLAMYT